MKVLDFMNIHEDWENLISQPPYNIKVKHDDNYILLKYNQLSSDFSLPIVRECRGSIFYLNQYGKYECVCRAFDKFGNYGESYVPNIDWNSALVEEKVDGSLMKVWYHNNMWHISTNGTIDAYKADVNDTGLTFGDLFSEAFNNSTMPKQFGCHDFLNSLNPNSTHMFELVSPKSRATISYPCTKLYYLGSRDMRTMEEYKVYDSELMWLYGVAYPKIFHLHTIEDCLNYVKAMTKDEEGFVVRDKDFNRIKIKSPEYLMAFHMNNNGAITTKRIIKMLQNETIDDFIAYCPEYQNDVKDIISTLNYICECLDEVWSCVEYYALDNRDDFAGRIAGDPDAAWLFKKYDNPNLSAIDYMMSLPINKLTKWVDGNKKILERT